MEQFAELAPWIVAIPSSYIDAFHHWIPMDFGEGKKNIKKYHYLRFIDREISLVKATGPMPNAGPETEAGSFLSSVQELLWVTMESCSHIFQ